MNTERVMARLRALGLPNALSAAPTRVPGGVAVTFARPLSAADEARLSKHGLQALRDPEDACRVQLWRKPAWRQPQYPKVQTTGEKNMEGLTEGRIVHYVLPDGRSAGAHRPAIVVMVCPKEWGYPPGAAQLQVFVDGTNDYQNYSGSIWATSVQYSEGKEPGTWHWIERA